MDFFLVCVTAKLCKWQVDWQWLYVYWLR